VFKQFKWPRPQCVNLLAYADDIVLIGKNGIELRQLFVEIGNIAKRLGLHINQGKTKYMIMEQKHSLKRNKIGPFIHSFHWHMQNATIPCRSQELLPFFSVIYFFLPPFSTNYSSILPHIILPSISWSTSQLCCFQTHM